MSEPNGQGTDSKAALGQLADDARPEPEPAGTPEDPWFAPGPKPQGYQPLDPASLDEAGWPSPGGAADAAGTESANGDAAAPQHAEEWFLRTGRAGLLPDSVSEIWDDEDTHVFTRLDTAGAPPWAGEQPAGQVEEPPPWESGPWPGPGEVRPVRTAGAASAGARRPGRDPADDVRNWPATAAVVAGIVPLIVPGVVLGVLGLRRTRSTGTGLLQSWLGIAFSAIWAVVLIIVLATGGQSGPDCSGPAQASVSTAMTAVLHDLSSGAAASTVEADLNHAISQANAAAAAAQQVSGRSALVALTTGLERALGAVQGSQKASSYATLRAQLAADNAAMTRACRG
jgi:hypothetical protein